MRRRASRCGEDTNQCLTAKRRVIIVTASDLLPRRLRGGVTVSVPGTWQRTAAQDVHAGADSSQGLQPNYL